MKVYDEDYGYIDKEKLRLIRLEEKKEYFEMKKQRNKTYLKGQRGKRLYYDYEKKYVNQDDNDDYADYDDEELEDKDLERRVKCVYTKDLRLEKLYGYLKYLNGRKILIRDLAFHFAVTERTIQTDLRWLENNGFIRAQTNKTFKGKQTKNSYFVNLEKEKDLPCDDTWLDVLFISKINNEHYILLKTSYTGKNNGKVKKPIRFYDFDLPAIKEKFFDRIDFHSLRLAKEIFQNEFRENYKGYILTHTQRKCFKDTDDFGRKRSERYKERCIFTWFLFEGEIEHKKGYHWIKLSVASRYLQNRALSKGIKHLQENILR